MFSFASFPTRDYDPRFSGVALVLRRISFSLSEKINGLLLRAPRRPVPLSLSLLLLLRRGNAFMPELSSVPPLPSPPGRPPFFLLSLVKCSGFFDFPTPLDGFHCDARHSRGKSWASFPPAAYSFSFKRRGVPFFPSFDLLHWTCHST